MRAVLGIDAAWTLTQPSGEAVAAEFRDGWHLIAAASSYQRFHALADSGQPAEERPSGSSPNASALLATASAQWRASVFADSAHDGRERPCVDRVAAELFHDRTVVVRQRLYWLFRLYLHDFVAVRLELDEQFWQRH